MEGWRRRALLSMTVASGSLRLEDGIAAMLRAIELQPANASLQSDLAALYLWDAERNGRALSLVNGLEAALTATALPLAPPEAFHNRALLLEKLFLTDLAEQAWREVLRREQNPFWRDEATSQLTKLERGRQTADTDSARVTVIRDRVRRQLRTLEDLQPTAAAKTVETLADDAAALRLATGDELLEVSVAALKESLVARDEARWHDLARAHALFERGYQAYQLGELARADADLAEASSLFDQRGSPFRFWPRFYRACVLQQQERYEASLARLGELENAIHDRLYWSLMGLMRWMEGQNRVQLGRPLDALTYFQSSVALFERTGERENQAVVRALLADCLLELGRQEEAWGELHEGLSLGQQLRQPRRAALLFNIAADTNFQYQRPRVARLFEDQAIAAARALGNPKIAYLTLLSRGMEAAATRDMATASEDLAQSRRLVDSIDDASSRDRAKADLAVLETAARADLSPTAKIDQLANAIAVYRQLDYQTSLTISAHEERSLLLAAQGDLRGATEDLVAAIRLYEQRLIDSPEKMASSDPKPRWSLRADGRRAYDRLVALYLAIGDEDGAFRTAERARQFSLYSEDFRNLLGGVAKGPMSLAEVQRRLGPQEVLVLFKRLDSQVLIWIVSSEGSHLLRRMFPADALRRAVDEFTEALRAGASDEQVRHASAALFEPLFADVLRNSKADEVLVIVPDYELFDLPAAALYTDAGVPLGALRGIIETPSVAVYLRGEQRVDETRPRSSRRALVVTNPAYDQRAWPTLSSLPEASAEGVAISRLYDDEMAVDGAAATRSVFLREAPHADVIHFAGHAIVNPRRADASLLLLASDTGEGSGAIYQRELYQLSLPRRPVVILGACESAALSGIPGEGLSSLAHAFLSAGASAVVGSLWPVRDETAAELMRRLHEGLRQGLSAERALQRAQIQFMEDGGLHRGDPWGWAAFEVIGASH